MSGYIDPFLSANVGATMLLANRYAAEAMAYYAEACDMGLAIRDLDPDQVDWEDDEAGGVWMRDGKTWPEWVRSCPDYGVAGGDRFIFHHIDSELARARKCWARAFRTIEELPDPRGVFESNCLGSPGRKGPCCRFDPPRCQTWPSIGLEKQRRHGEARSSVVCVVEKETFLAIDARADATRKTSFSEGALHPLDSTEAQKGNETMGTQSFNKDTAKRGNLWQFDPKDLVIIGVDTKDGPEHELYDERAFLPMDESMTLSIADGGVDQSVTIRKNASTGKAEVVDGRRRVLHAREANKRLKKAGEPLVLIPCILKHGGEDVMAETAIKLNEIRYEDPMMVKVAKCERLLARNGDDYKAAARAFGVTTAAIKNWVKVSELTPKVKKAIDRGEISASAAAQLHGMEKEAQIKELDKLTDGAKKSGKKKATTKSAKKAAGKKIAVAKRVLKRLIEDEELSAKVEPEIIFGIKLALGEYVPEPGSKLAKLLEKAGHTF